MICFPDAGLQEATVFIYATFCIRAATTQQQLQPGLPGAMFISARMLRTATSPVSHSVSASAASSTWRCIVLRNGSQHDGKSAVIPQALSRRCQMVSVMNGMIGCARRSRTFQYSHQRMASTAQFGFGATVHYRLGQLQIPVTELGSGELIQNAWGDIEAEAVQASRYALMSLLNSARIQRSASDSVISPPLKRRNRPSVFSAQSGWRSTACYRSYGNLPGASYPS